jgi:hypothetical protein
LIQRRVGVRCEGARNLHAERIARLGEILIVADKVAEHSIEDRASTALNVELKQFVSGGVIYSRVTKAIRAELVALQNRKSDNLFLVGLRDFEARLNSFRGWREFRQRCGFYFG